jgi:hypothetical protein
LPRVSRRDRRNVPPRWACRKQDVVEWGANYRQISLSHSRSNRDGGDDGDGKEKMPTTPSGDLEAREERKRNRNLRGSSLCWTTTTTTTREGRGNDKTARRCVQVNGPRRNEAGGKGESASGGGDAVRNMKKMRHTKKEEEEEEEKGTPPTTTTTTPASKSTPRAGAGRNSSNGSQPRGSDEMLSSHLWGRTRGRER